MRNIIRADIYRIIRGKALYFSFAALLALNVLIVSSQESGTIGMAMNEIDEVYDMEATREIPYNGAGIAEVLYMGMDNIVYFLLPLFILAAAAMFTHGTVKNSLSAGMSRTKLYFSKLIINAVFCLMAMLFYMLTGILLATAMRGFGGPVPDGYWLATVKICSSQLLMVLGMCSLATFLIFTTKKTSVVIALYIAICFIPAIIVVSLVNATPDIVQIYDYDLTGNIRKLSFMDALETADFIKAFATAAFYLVVPTGLGIGLFRRAEIK